MANPKTTDDDITNRLYVTAEQIIISNEGIFYDSEEGYSPITMICSDEGGLFIPNYTMGRYGECRNGHSTSCAWCGRCNGFYAQCPYACKCYK